MIDEIRKELRNLEGVESVILFGSYARGDMDDRSDIDLCIITKDGNAEGKISEKILDLEKTLDKNIQVVYTDPEFTGQDPNFMENILREGKTLIGDPPTPTLERLGLEPYMIFKYDLSKLSQPDKMRFHRILYGKKTRKKYKEKTYVSQKEGIVEKTGSEKVGRASILAPQDKASMMEKTLRDAGVSYRKTPTWMPKK
ncbi:MAG: nucleotidyltransferase domain-containing protein [Candidatus Altiarchaeota archaeon]